MLWCLGEVDSAREGDDEVAGLRDAVGGVSRRGVGGGAWCAEKKPGRSGFGSTRGHGAWPARWHRRRTAPPVGVVHGKQRREERDAVGGNFVNKAKFKKSFL